MVQLYYQKVIFESDSLELVSMINNEEQRPSLAPILQGIKLLLSRIQELKLVLSPREGNEVADRIARESLSLLNDDPRLYHVMPNWIKKLY